MLAGGMALAQQPPPPGQQTPPPGPAPQPAQSDLSADRARLAELLNQYQETHPYVVRLRKKIEQEEAPAAISGRMLRGPGAGPGIPSPAGRPVMSELMAGRPGRWWSNPDMAQKLGLSADQVKRMDDIFQQFRLQLIDLNANLQKQELILEPLVSADQPDEPKILSQIDKVVQARAELEKANARMLLGVRRVLSQEQWQKLKADAPKRRLPEPPRPKR
jgi:Spy/CpxP family protein refolding chaperone